LAVFVVKGTTVTLSPFIVMQNDAYRLVLTGGGVKDGDIDLTVTFTAKNSWKDPGGSLDAMAPGTFSFAAPAGSRAQVSVIPGPHSGFRRPTRRPDGHRLHAGARRAAAGRVGAAPGNRRVPRGVRQLRRHGRVAGERQAEAAEGLRRRRSTSATARSAARSRAATPSSERVLGTDGGTVDLSSAPAGPLTGSSVTVPANTLGGPVVIHDRRGRSVPSGQRARRRSDRGVRAERNGLRPDGERRRASRRP